MDIHCFRHLICPYFNGLDDKLTWNNTLFSKSKLSRICLGYFRFGNGVIANFSKGQPKTLKVGASLKGNNRTVTKMLLKIIVHKIFHGIRKRKHLFGYINGNMTMTLIYSSDIYSLFTYNAIRGQVLYSCILLKCLNVFLIVIKLQSNLTI